MYGAETWVLSKADELRLGVFERKILRRIYRPICEGVTWRSRYNEGLYRLYDEIDLVTTIRITRLRWAGHIVRMHLVFVHVPSRFKHSLLPFMDPNGSIITWLIAQEDIKQFSNCESFKFYF